MKKQPSGRSGYQSVHLIIPTQGHQVKEHAELYRQTWVKGVQQLTAIKPYIKNSNTTMCNDERAHDFMKTLWGFSGSLARGTVQYRMQLLILLVYHFCYYVPYYYFSNLQIGLKNRLRESISFVTWWLPIQRKLECSSTQDGILPTIC